MSQAITLKLNKEKINQMQQHYQGSTIKTPPYAVFSAKLPGVTVTAYQSGKVLFQGNNATVEASHWGSITTPTAKPRIKEKASTALPKGFVHWSVLGSDEVGNGSYLGPLVVCAAYATTEQLPLLRELGVKDSKMLTDPMIRSIAKELLLFLPHHKLIVTPEKYNQIQPKYNATRMKVALHNQAIYLLLEKIAPEKPQAILIDQFTSETNYRNYLKQEQHPVTDSLYFITKGEQYHLSVAAASIICRATFLDELDKATKKVGFKIPSGAGAASDQAAAKLLKIGGLPLLQKHAKLHFANTEKAKKIAYH